MTCVLSHFSCVRLFTALWTVTCQALSIHGILQARILEWVAIPSSRDLSDPGIKLQAITSPALILTCSSTSSYDLKYQLLGISTIIPALLHVYTSLVHLQLLCHSDVCL